MSKILQTNAISLDSDCFIFALSEALGNKNVNEQT